MIGKIWSLNLQQPATNNLWSLIHTASITHSICYTQPLLYTASDTYSFYYTQSLIHTASITCSLWHTQPLPHTGSQALPHTGSTTHNLCYTQAHPLLHTASQALPPTTSTTHRLTPSATHSLTSSATHRLYHPQPLLHTGSHPLLHTASTIQPYEVANKICFNLPFHLLVRLHKPSKEGVHSPDMTVSTSVLFSTSLLWMVSARLRCCFPFFMNSSKAFSSSGSMSCSQTSCVYMRGFMQPHPQLTHACTSLYTFLYINSPVNIFPIFILPVLWSECKEWELQHKMRHKDL